MLTRIYGTAFPKQKELDEYLEKVEAAKARDHKKLGKVKIIIKPRVNRRSNGMFSLRIQLQNSGSQKMRRRMP